MYNSRLRPRSATHIGLHDRSCLVRSWPRSPALVCLSPHHDMSPAAPAVARLAWLALPGTAVDAAFAAPLLGLPMGAPRGLRGTCSQLPAAVRSGRPSSTSPQLTTPSQCIPRCAPARISLEDGPWALLGCIAERFPSAAAIEL
jgi:hypothetical protein